VILYMFMMGPERSDGPFTYTLCTFTYTRTYIISTRDACIESRHVVRSSFNRAATQAAAIPHFVSAFKSSRVAQ
jgi:hypothetical protein